ncbi:arylamine N-acetyltransferase family protein [Kistimonas asteriae]|uniref:arylamine N-acetyltransferase family protein n=1 Tax=Kistimonas asteriae TaxID=517724 RepID=UPI001BA615A7|nr:arylamine N-acetyltransferase [Kistimonas asteriae]
MTADVQRYLDRIEYVRNIDSSAECLRALHVAHLNHVPYETIDLRLAIPLSMGIAAIYEKVVYRHRGGYCYELNRLFSWLLRKLGFKLHYLSASLWHGERGFGPEYEHLILLVEGDPLWLLDVGHGDVFDNPMPLEDGRVQAEPVGEFCLRNVGDDWHLLRRSGGDGWVPQYRFTLKACCFRQFLSRVAWTQASPLSAYRNRTIVYRSAGTGRLLLNTDTLTHLQAQHCSHRKVDKIDYLDVLASVFGIELPGCTPVEALLAPDGRTAMAEES